MKQEFRVILAMALSVGIFITYQNYFAPPIPPMATTPAASVAQTAPSPITQTVAPQNISAALVAAADATDVDFVAKAQTLLITNDKAKFTLNTVGGVLTSGVFTDYGTTAEKDSAPKDILETPDSYALFLGFSGYDALTPDKVFQITKDETSGGVRHITLAWQDQNLRVEKLFAIGDANSPYVVTVSYNVMSRTGHSYTLTPYIENRVRQKIIAEPKGLLSKLSNSEQDYFHPLYSKDGKLTGSSFNWKKYFGSADTGNIGWTAISDRYFMVASAPQPGQTAMGAIDYKRLNDGKGDFLSARFSLSPISLNPGAQASGGFFNFMGPKKMSELGALPVPLKQSVDYGWFSVLAIPILWLMRLLHQVIPNWGLVIIALTFIIKMLTFPINKKSLTSMKAMQQLQPKLQEIKKKYPEDKIKQNEEVMQLFKTHGVNPLGGCLPMLLQMPVYIVLYKVLWNAIELYHAPFLWYKDLSAPDPYFFAPVLLGVFMFLQQKLTPNASADPAQQKMMLFMPLLFSVFMLFLPVGLVIYIFVNTFLSVIQQFMMTRDLTFKDLLSGKWQARTV